VSQGGLLDDRARRRGVLLEVGGQLIPEDRLDRALDIAVPELGLRLPLELGLGDADGENAGETLPEVVAGERLPVLEEVLPLRVGVEGAREHRLQPGEMRSSLVRVDVVHEGEQGLGVGVVVLERHLHLVPVPLAGEEDHILVKDLLVAVQVLDEGPNAPS
jgi:hypothetical protein